MFHLLSLFVLLIHQFNVHLLSTIQFRRSIDLADRSSFISETPLNRTPSWNRQTVQVRMDFGLTVYI